MMGSQPTPEPSSLSSHEFGRWGEAVAAERYQLAGFELLDRNWRCREGEIDLIVARFPEIVFVEVKARATDRYGSGAEAVGWRKQQKIRSVALRWLAESPLRFQDIRFDVATVDITGAVTVYESCF